MAPCIPLLCRCWLWESRATVQRGIAARKISWLGATSRLPLGSLLLRLIYSRDARRLHLPDASLLHQHVQRGPNLNVGFSHFEGQLSSKNDIAEGSKAFRETSAVGQLRPLEQSSQLSPPRTFERSLSRTGNRVEIASRSTRKLLIAADLTELGLDESDGPEDASFRRIFETGVSA
jgi:hypothetical protein